MSTKKISCISVFFFFAFVSSSCNSGVDQKKLQGAWRIDSLYDFYNGFTYMNRNPQPAEVHVYKGEHTMLRRGMGHERPYYYSIDGNKLMMSDTLGAPASPHIVLRLDSSQLVLKKESAPIFPGEKQERYVIRYFTKIPLDSLK